MRVVTTLVRESESKGGRTIQTPTPSLATIAYATVATRAFYLRLFHIFFKKSESCRVRVVEAAMWLRKEAASLRKSEVRRGH